MESGERRGKVVMIVEDEPDNRDIMRAVVEDLLGGRAVLVANGSEAVEKAANAQPHVVLMDLMMPVLDGFEAIRTLKTDPRTSHIPVVAVTALSRPVDRERALNAGAEDCIYKPFDLDDLVSLIERYAGKAAEVESEEVQVE